MQLTRVKLCRFSKGIMQVELARRTQIAHTRLSEIESGHVEPQADELERLAKVLGVAPDLLLPSAAHTSPVPRLSVAH